MAMTQRSMTSIADGNNMANEASTKMMNAAKVMAANAETQSSSVEELTVVANELSTSTDGVSYQIARFNFGNPRSGRRATASAPAPTTAPAPAAPEMDAPVSTSAMMNGNASAGLDVDERGFGRY